MLLIWLYSLFKCALYEEIILRRSRNFFPQQIDAYNAFDDLEEEQLLRLGLTVFCLLMIADMG